MAQGLYAQGVFCGAIFAVAGPEQPCLGWTGEATRYADDVIIDILDDDDIIRRPPPPPGRDDAGNAARLSLAVIIIPSVVAVLVVAAVFYWRCVARKASNLPPDPSKQNDSVGGGSRPAASAGQAVFGEWGAHGRARVSAAEMEAKAAATEAAEAAARARLAKEQASEAVDLAAAKGGGRARRLPSLGSSGASSVGSQLRSSGASSSGVDLEDGSVTRGVANGHAQELAPPPRGSKSAKRPKAKGVATGMPTDDAAEAAMEAAWAAAEEEARKSTADGTAGAASAAGASGDRAAARRRAKARADRAGADELDETSQRRRRRSPEIKGRSRRDGRDGRDGRRTPGRDGSRRRERHGRVADTSGSFETACDLVTQWRRGGYDICTMLQGLAQLGAPLCPPELLDGELIRRGDARGIRKAYHRAASTLHPDRVRDQPAEVRAAAEEIFKMLSEAYRLSREADRGAGALVKPSAGAQAAARGDDGPGLDDDRFRA